MNCKNCKTAFRPHSSIQKYCSKKCCNAAGQRRATVRKRSRGLCSDCAKPAMKFRCTTCSKRHLEKIRRHNRALRTQFIEMYGGKCSCCGETMSEFLTLDHVKNNGRQERRSMTNWKIYKRAVKEHRPNEYDVLCMNCNWARGKYGVCPHKREES